MLENFVHISTTQFLIDLVIPDKLRDTQTMPCQWPDATKVYKFCCGGEKYAFQQKRNQFSLSLLKTLVPSRIRVPSMLIAETLHLTIDHIVSTLPSADLARSCPL